MNSAAPFRDPRLVSALAAAIAAEMENAGRPLTLMEVCGTHSMAIRRHGLLALLPARLRLLSGPGCPVCVTPIGYLDHALALARQPDTLIATFGDLLRVPGSAGSLQHARAAGAAVRVVGSPLEAVALAKEQPHRRVVFLAVGFETTAPTVAAALLTARQQRLENFFLLVAHKSVPPALSALAWEAQRRIDGFLCPAHVAAVTGTGPFRPLADELGMPCVIAGFEPVDILQGVLMLIRQAVAGAARVENQYRRAVRPDGNPQARELLARVFAPADSEWRGLGTLPASGLHLRAAFAAADAAVALPVTVPPPREPAGCRCGEILTGRCRPRDCPLFGSACTPEQPVGACMVSSEGSCAAEYRYG